MQDILSDQGFAVAHLVDEHFKPALVDFVTGSVDSVGAIACRPTKYDTVNA
jgi:hypothetical protein